MVIVPHMFQKVAIYIIEKSATFDSSLEQLLEYSLQRQPIAHPHQQGMTNR